MTESTKNRIQKDDLDLYGEREYLTEDSEITRKINAYLQHDVDEWMEGLVEDNETNLRVTSAVINEIRSIAISLRHKGVRVEEPQVREPWRLLGMSAQEWQDSQAADRTRGALSGYDDPYTG